LLTKEIFLMFRTLPSLTNNLSIEEVIQRFSQTETVTGILLIGANGTNGANGTTGTSNVDLCDEFDLLIVLAEEPAPLHVAITTVDHRMTDVYFTRLADLEQIDALPGPEISDSWVGKQINWLKTGHIVYDPSGFVARLAGKLSSGVWSQPAANTELYRAWFNINYNLRQNQRLLATDDTNCLAAMDLRLLNNLSDIFYYYFRFRRLPWLGEKAAIRYLAVHDQVFLKLFKETILECDRSDKMENYARLAAISTQPVGGLWKNGITAFQFESGAELAQNLIEETFSFWEDIFKSDN
jgi:hypothetical protein